MFAIPSIFKTDTVNFHHHPQSCLAAKPKLLFLVAPGRAFQGLNVGNIHTSKISKYIIRRFTSGYSHRCVDLKALF
jgi:hypothetical protein